MLTVRRATLEDMETLIRLRIALLQSSGTIQNEAEKEVVAQANRAYFTETLPTERFLAWVAEFDSQIVGCGGLVFFERPPLIGNLAGKEAYILNIYTLPAWRSQGVATGLLRTILAFLKEAGITRIRLHATEAGRRLYEKHGFTATSTEMELLW